MWSEFSWTQFPTTVNRTHTKNMSVVWRKFKNKSSTQSTSATLVLHSTVPHALKSCTTGLAADLLTARAVVVQLKIWWDSKSNYFPSCMFRHTERIVCRQNSWLRFAVRKSLLTHVQAAGRLVKAWSSFNIAAIEYHDIGFAIYCGFRFSCMFSLPIVPLKKYILLEPVCS